MTIQEQAQAWLPILEAMASGKVIQVFNGEWEDKVIPDLISGIEYRIKPETIIVNGFEIESPMEEAPEIDESVYISDATCMSLCCSLNWSGNTFCISALSRGLCHKTRAAAIAHAKAMIGIDPNK